MTAAPETSPPAPVGAEEQADEAMLEALRWSNDGKGALPEAVLVKLRLARTALAAHATAAPASGVEESIADYEANSPHGRMTLGERAAFKHAFLAASPKAQGSDVGLREALTNCLRAMSSAPLEAPSGSFMQEWLHALHYGECALAVSRPDRKGAGG